MIEFVHAAAGTVKVDAVVDIHSFACPGSCEQQNNLLKLYQVRGEPFKITKLQNQDTSEIGELVTKFVGKKLCEVVGKQNRTIQILCTNLSQLVGTVQFILYIEYR